MSLRVRSVSGRSLVPCPPTRMTAGRLMIRLSDHEHGGAWGTGRFPTFSGRRGHAGETWSPPRPRADGERCSYDGPPDAFIREAERAHLVGIQQVAAVHDHRVSHAPGRRSPVELAQLGPFGDDYG